LRPAHRPATSHPDGIGHNAAADLVDEGEQSCPQRFALTLTGWLGGHLSLLMQLTVRIDDPGSHLGAADIDREHLVRRGH
jgi:hypothetical protein